MKDHAQQTFLEYAPPEQQHYSGLAIASVTCAAISLFAVLLPLSATTARSIPESVLIVSILLILVGALASLIFGIGALAYTSREWNQPFRGRWMALTGIIYSVLFCCS
ncbi:MAG: hypothetical protein FWD61_04205 [Phycisphaerales bacterium]|nr:hypothetical protein [Phycisphaerales bacterium]